MVGIWHVRDNALGHEKVCHSLHALPGHAHLSGDLRHGARRFGHGSNDLPAGLRLACWGRQRRAMVADATRVTEIRPDPRQETGGDRARAMLAWRVRGGVIRGEEERSQ